MTENNDTLRESAATLRMLCRMETGNGAEDVRRVKKVLERAVGEEWLAEIPVWAVLNNTRRTTVLRGRLCGRLRNFAFCCEQKREKEVAVALKAGTPLRELLGPSVEKLRLLHPNQKAFKDAKYLDDGIFLHQFALLCHLRNAVDSEKWSEEEDVDMLRFRHSFCVSEQVVVSRYASSTGGLMDELQAYGALFDQLDALSELYGDTSLYPEWDQGTSSRVPTEHCEEPSDELKTERKRGTVVAMERKVAWIRISDSDTTAICFLYKNPDLSTMMAGDSVTLIETYDERAGPVATDVELCDVPQPASPSTPPSTPPSAPVSAVHLEAQPETELRMFFSNIDQPYEMVDMILPQNPRRPDAE